MTHPMDEKTLISLLTGTREVQDRNRPAQEIAEERLIRNGKGELGLTSDMLFAAMVEAGRLIKHPNGKGNLSTAQSSFLGALIDFHFDEKDEDGFLRFEHSNGTYMKVEWKTDTRRGCLPKDGTAVCIVRPLIREWAVNVRIIYDPKKLPLKTLIKLIRDAGEYHGLGAFRVNCKGTFGKFAIESAEDVTPDKWLEESETPLVIKDRHGNILYQEKEMIGTGADDVDESATSQKAGVAPGTPENERGEEGTRRKRSRITSGVTSRKARILPPTSENGKGEKSPRRRRSRITASPSF